MKDLKLLTKKRFRLLALILCLTASIPQLWADNTYVVAGEPAAVFGTTWNTTLSSNQMTNYATNSYMLIKPNCNLTGANIYYKVVGDGSNWYGNSSGQNFQISTGSGTYDVIFGFYSDNTTYQVYQILQRVNIAGCTELMGVYWDTSQNRMTAGTTSYTLTLTDVSLSTGTTYTYKAVVDGNTWYGQGGTTSGGNYELTVTETGVYDVTFEYNPITHKTTTRTTLKSTPADTYVVAGPAAMFGDNWNGTSTANTMTEGNDGKYRLTLYNLTLTASTSYEYKVVKNGTEWIPNTVDNASFSVALNGAYDVTFIYDPSTGVYNVECTLQTATGDETYTVAGSNTVILGSSWDPTDSNNDMSLVSGVFQLTFNDVVLSDNNPSCEFRIAVNHSWVTAYPSGNANVSGFDGSGTYDIVFTYNPTTHDVTGVATKHVVIVNYYVLGDNTTLWPGGWSTTDIPASQQMTNNDGTYTWAVQNVHLDFGDFGFKVYDSEGTYHPQNAGNVQIEVGAAGTYDLTITLNPSNSDTPVATLTPVSLDPLAYSVIGSSALFGGTDWANAQAMTDDGDGTYSWDSGNLQLNAGTYTFKVKDNQGHWFGTAGSGNGDDIEVYIPANGTYTVHIDFDGTNAPTYQLHRVDLPTIYITGSLGTGWSPVPTAMTYNSSTGLYSIEYNVINPGTYAFVFADGQGNNADDWDNFNANYRIGPTSGNDETVTLNGDWTQTQYAGGNNGAYQVNLGVGNYTILYDPTYMKFKVVGGEPIYITGDLGLGLGWTYNPSTAMTYDNATGTYSYTYRVPNQGTYRFVFASGRVRDIDDQGQAWDAFNSTYRIGPSHDGSDNETVTLGQWANTQQAGGDHGAYEVTLPAGNVTIYFDNSTSQMKFKVESEEELGYELYMVGGLTYEDSIHYYAPNDGVLMKYDNSKKLYYLNHVTLNTNSTFCFSHELGINSEDWAGMGTRFGNNDTDDHYFVPEENDITAHLKVTGDKIDVNMPLAEWTDEKGEWMMYTAGIYNVIVNLEDGWVKLIKTDHFSLFPMNVYLQQTDNVEISNVGAPGTVYSAEDFNGYWPLIAWNRTDVPQGETEGHWDPHGNHYSVTYMGDTTTTDNKKWWHWQVSASIAEIIFTRTNQSPYQSPTIDRKAGVLWYTWEEDNTMTAHSREYFSSSATTLPGNVVVEEGHYYVYFINTVGWETVYCYAWGGPTSPYIDGHGKDLGTWPGQAMTCIGIDPMTGYEVWEYDFGAIEDSYAPSDLLFHDGTPIATTDAKEQTGDFDFINGGVYDYLGLFDDAYTLNSLIRIAKKNVRYTISNDLVGVYYDPDAKTEVTYKLSNGTDHTETVTGALYAKDLNDYGEKSKMPEGDEYYDYVYGICGTSGTDPRISQIMDKKDEYDQSNWIKLVVSPNYDGASNLPVSAPDLEDYVDHIIPANTLHVYLTDSINPTARVMAIQMGAEVEEYEPNVYISEHFNDTIVFNYTHREWQLDSYKGVYRTQPHVEWKQNGVGGNIYAEVTRERVDDKTYKMFYVAPKPQEIAYITWVVYDNYNEPQNGVPPYGNYESGVYTPYTTEGKFLPTDPGRFFSPRNFDRSENIPLSYLEELVDKNIITQAQLDSLRNNYLSEDQLEDIFGGYGQQYGPYANGYMQYGGIKVNWSLFDESKSGNEPWWQIFRPGQAYKFKAIIRYARGSEGVEGANNYCYGPSNGEDEGTGTVLGAPRRDRDGNQTYFPNLYFTDDYKYLDESKFIIFPIEASSAVSNGSGMGNVTDVREVIQDVATPRTVASVRYYNLMGVESDKPFDGLNIVVTTYSDGSRTSKKILR